MINVILKKALTMNGNVIKIKISTYSINPLKVLSDSWIFQTNHLVNC